MTRHTVVVLEFYVKEEKDMELHMFHIILLKVKK